MGLLPIYRLSAIRLRSEFIVRHSFPFSVQVSERFDDDRRARSLENVVVEVDDGNLDYFRKRLSRFSSGFFGKSRCVCFRDALLALMFLVAGTEVGAAPMFVPFR